jgi:polysaccharide biosynthesis protein PslA
MEGIMPGMAEQDIALKLTGGAAAMPRQLPVPGASATAHRGLVARGLALCAVDALVTCALGIMIFAMAGPSLPISAPVLLVLFVIAALVSASLWERGLYSAPALLCTDVRFRVLAMGWLQGLGLALVIAYSLISLNAAAARSPALSDVAAVLRGAWLPVFFVSGLVGIATVRLVRCRWVRAATPPNRTVIVGATEICEELLHHLRRQDGHPLNVIGIVRHDSPVNANPGADILAVGGLPVLGALDTLLRMIREDQVDTVLVAVPWTEAEAAKAVVRKLAMSPIDVYVIPDLDGVEFSRRQASVVAGVPMLLASNRPLGEWQAIVKRAEDLLIASVVLLAAGPAMLAIALLVRCTSRGPALFRQRRLGFNNRIIEVYKFRSMYVHLADADARQQTLRGDKRVTPLGAWLRRSSLDELPQLLNVLRGDMSIVGPRPHALQTTAGGLPLEDAVPVYPSRHRVKPGITGWAQVNGYRGALDSVDKIVLRVNHDLYYIENWSLLFDIKILWRTARLMVVDDNAF